MEGLVQFGHYLGQVVQNNSIAIFAPIIGAVVLRHFLQGSRRLQRRFPEHSSATDSPDPPAA